MVRPEAEMTPTEVRTGFSLLARVIAETMADSASYRETAQDLRLLRLAEGDDGA